MSRDREPSDAPDPASPAPEPVAPRKSGGGPVVRRASVHGSIAPGRRIPTSYMPVQRRARAEDAQAPTPAAPSDRPMVGSGYGSPIPPMAELLDPGPAVRGRAAEGVAGTGGPLPFLDQIQPAFGRYDISGVEAHVGGPAASAAADLGADAYATGDQVAFASAPDLHTAAHEAAHVVQQRGGIQLKGGVGQEGDAYEQHADRVADRVVAGESAEALLAEHADPGGGGGSGGPVQRRLGGGQVQRHPAGGQVQRHPAGGALVTEDEARKRDAAAADVFPGPVVLSPLGDPLEVRLGKVDGKLAVTITYLGGHPVDATQPSTAAPAASRQVVLRPDRRAVAGAPAADPARPYAAVLVGRGHDQVLFDLYGDGGSILEVRDQVDPAHRVRFDRRTHVLDARLNGYPSMPGTLSLHLPTGAGRGEDHVATAPLELNGETFALRARRHGDAAAVVLSFARGGEDSALVVPLGGAPRAQIALRVLSSDGRTLELDLDGDGKPDARLIHTIYQPRHPRGGVRPSLDDDFAPRALDDEPFHVHELAAYDRDGVRVGTLTRRMPGHLGSVPRSQDAALEPAPEGAAMPAGREPVQGDVPGETPRAVQHPARDWELRIDGDGDRTKEILLRFAPRPGPPDKERTIALSVTQLSSGASASATFVLTADQAHALDLFGPGLVMATDGERSNQIQLGKVTSDAPILRFYADPHFQPGGTTYQANIGGAQKMTFTLPKETRATAALAPDLGMGPPETRTVGTIQMVEVALSEYRDRFRLTAEKVDSGNVLLGVSAIGPEGPVAGFSTRLKNIEDVRLEGAVHAPQHLTFMVRRDWGFANLSLTSALDPPRDAQGRVIDGPPSAHRDHRLMFDGDAVVGRPEHTFRVRDGRFVGGWEKSTDNRHASGAAMAVGVLDEQGRHPHVDELRVQIDTALDQEVRKAVGLGWIDGLTADAWDSLTSDMLFIQVQAASGTVPPRRAARAAEAADAIEAWLEQASRGGKNWMMAGAERRLAPGEASPGDDTPRITGTGFNTRSGQLWKVKDGVPTEMRAAGYGARTARTLEKGLYGPAIASYGLLRGGVNRWLADKFASDPKFGPTSAEASRMSHLVDMSDKLHDLEAVQRKTRELDTAVDGQVGLAGQRGLIDPATVAAWQALREQMVTLGALAASGKPDPSLVEQALASARALDAWLSTETAGQAQPTAYGQENRFTGERQLPSGPGTWITAVKTSGALLRDRLQAGEVAMAGDSYRNLRDGVVRWLAEKTEARFGKGSAEAGAIAGVQAARAARRDVVRVPATFIADDSYEKKPDLGEYKQADFGKYRQVPLQLFVWAEDDEWHIRDLFNPKSVFKASVPFAGEAQPPAALFQALDHIDHLPKGDIRYQLPDGTGGRVRCRAAKEWYHWVSEAAMVLAAVGVVFMTLGAATPLVVTTMTTVAFTASMVAGTVGAIGKVADKIEHGTGDQSLALDFLEIAGNLAGLGMMASGKLAMGAARAATIKGGAGAWTGTWAHLARAGSLSYRALAGISVQSGALSLLVMTGDLEAQLAEIDRTVKDPSERLLARAKALARFAAMGGLVLMGIKGDLPDLRTGGPRIVLDRVDGVTIARLGGVELGGKAIDVPEGDARMHAEARWQSRDVEHEASGADGKRKEQAGELLASDELKGWYARWMAQPEKILPGPGRPRVWAPEGAPPPVTRRLQEMVDRGDFALHKQAFDRADDIARLRAEHPDLDLDPRNQATWPDARAKLVERLGGGAPARRQVERYEAARLGAGADLGRYAQERGRINRVLPDSELETIRGLFPEHEVYLTTEPARAGQPRADHIEVAVVVRTGTEPDVMQAIEQRAASHRVRPEPSYLKGQDRPASETLPLRVKAMTEDQFFGMSTASLPGRGAPRYHRLGDDLARAVGLGSLPVRAVGEGRYAVAADHLTSAHEMWKQRGGHQVTRLRYDADAHAMYFEVHGGRGQGRVRVEAPLPGRITSAADMDLPNRIVGTRILGDLGQAENILRAITRGDLAVITRELGVALPRGYSTADGTEFGIGMLPDGRFVIVRGATAEVDWGQLPGIKGVAHTHPSIKGNDLPEDAAGKRQVPLARLAENTDVPLAARAPIYPSPGDVAYVAGQGLRDHRVFTPFVIDGGQVMKPEPGWTGNARLEFRIVDARLVGRVDPDGVPVHRATIIGLYEGKEVLRNDVHVTGSTSAEPMGLMYTRQPPGFVPTPAGAGQAARRGGTAMPTRAESEAQLLMLRDKLSAEGKAELDRMSRGREPEEVWGMLAGKGDPVRRIEARARQADRLAAGAAAKDVRVDEAHKTLRDTGFYDSPLVTAAIKRGDRDAVRNRLSEHIAVIRARKELDGKAGHQVLDDVEVARRFGEFKTKAEAEASLPAGETRHFHELDGRVWERVTNFDVLVLNGREIVKMGEVKSGANDRQARAKTQQKKGLDALAEIATGNPDVRLHHRRARDITDQVDAATAHPDKARTIGPAGKGFDEDLGLSQTDLNRLAREIIEHGAPTTGTGAPASKVDDAPPPSGATIKDEEIK